MDLEDQVKPKKRFADYFDIMKQESASDNVFKSFIPKPKKVKFDLQHDNEEIFLVLRQHPITQLKTILALFFSIFFVPWLLKNSGLIAVLPQNFRILFYVFLIVIFFGIALRSFLLWFFSVNIVTNERIIDVDFLSIIYKNISITKNRNIQDVTKQSSGVMASIFDYGTIYIQTAGAKNEFEFDHVPQPAKVTKLLNEIMRKEKRTRPEFNQDFDQEEKEQEGDNN